MGINMSLDRTIFPVHRNPREVSHMLVGSRQLIKQCRLSTILISHQRICKCFLRRQRFFASFYMVFSFFTKSRMFRITNCRKSLMFPGSCINLLNLYLIRICQTQSQFITMNLQFHGISHRCKFNNGHLCPRNYTHIQKMLAKRSLSTNR